MATNEKSTQALLPLYKGSCHCKFISYTVRLDLINPSPETGAILTKCNCSICHKSGSLLGVAAPDSLTILSPPEGYTVLQDYTFGGGKTHHWLCPRCGIKCFLEGNYTYENKEVRFSRINVLTLDGKEDGTPLEDLRQVKVFYWDGKALYWDGDTPGGVKGLSEKPWEGGVW